MSERPYRWEPPVGLRAALPLVGDASWETIDREASRLLGRPCLGIPSVRVAIAWILDYLGYARHADHVLVPRFMGRCILNAINRFALPVTEVSARTRAVIAVHEYGLRPDLEAIQARCREQGLVYIEDSPFGLAEQESIGPGAIAKVIGLAKALPIVKGGLVLTDDEGLAAAIRERRARPGRGAWLSYLIVANLRRRPCACAYSVAADAAYELYVPAGGDPATMRRHLRRGLATLDADARPGRERLERLRATLGQHLLLPATDRTPHLVPLLPGDRLPALQTTFRDLGLVADAYHLDRAGNPFAPDYAKVLLIPLNPQIPEAVFDRLLDRLKAGLDT